MSDYYGAATLEDWLGEEVFHLRVVPHFIVMRFEAFRDVVERDIENWMASDDGDGNSLSWRGWGRGFANIPMSDEEFDALIKKAQSDLFDARRILCSANKLPDGTLLLGARHWDTLMHDQFRLYLKAKNLTEDKVVGNVKQGFIDQWGNYLNREAAWYLATHKGQVVNTGPGYNGPELYSENLY